MPVEQTKWIGFTKSAQGLLLMLPAIIAPMAHFTWGFEEGNAWAGLINAGLGFVGAAWSFYGIVTRKSMVKVLP